MELAQRLRALEQAAQALLDVLDCTVNGTCVDCRRDVGNDEQHDEDCSVWRVSQLAHPAYPEDRAVVCWVVVCADETLHCSSHYFHLWPVADNPDAEDTCVINAAHLDDDGPSCGPHAARPLVFGDA